MRRTITTLIIIAVAMVGLTSCSTRGDLLDDFETLAGEEVGDRGSALKLIDCALETVRYKDLREFVDANLALQAGDDVSKYDPDKLQETGDDFVEAIEDCSDELGIDEDAF